MLAHWNNSPRVDMSLHFDTLLWFLANQSLLLLLNDVCLAEKQQGARSEHANHYTIDAVVCPRVYLNSLVCSFTSISFLRNKGYLFLHILQFLTLGNGSCTLIMILIWKDSLNSECQQFHQYQRNRTITSHLKSVNTKNKITTYIINFWNISNHWTWKQITTHAVWNPGPDFRTGTQMWRCFTY